MKLKLFLKNWLAWIYLGLITQVPLLFWPQLNTIRIFYFTGMSFIWVGFMTCE